MKKWNKILMSSALVLMLAMFTGCGRNDNAADETKREQDKTEEKDTVKDKDTRTEKDTTTTDKTTTDRADGNTADGVVPDAEMENDGTPDGAGD